MAASLNTSVTGCTLRSVGNDGGRVPTTVCGSSSGSPEVVGARSCSRPGATAVGAGAGSLLWVLSDGDAAVAVDGLGALARPTANDAIPTPATTATAMTERHGGFLLTSAIDQR